MERYFIPEDIAHLEHTEWRASLAMIFSDYLNEYRYERDIPIQSLGITATMPACSEGIIRLPHLVVFQENNETQDLALWERITAQDARIWLGTSLPNQDYIESHLEDLLAMKRRIRTSEQLTKTDRLVKEKIAGRYLSILFVYQNFQLFKDIWR